MALHTPAHRIKRRLVKNTCVLAAAAVEDQFNPPSDLALQSRAILSLAETRAIRHPLGSWRPRARLALSCDLIKTGSHPSARRTLRAAKPGVQFLQP